MDIRCFIAVNIDDALKDEIGKSISVIKTDKWDVKWVPAQNLHITLKFLGSIPEGSVKEISERLSLVSSSNEQFSIRFFGTGIFPDIKRPRVVWIDIINHDNLKRIQEEVEISLASSGFERDNKLFSPHLTIGRLRSLRGKDALLKEIEALKYRDFGNIEVKKISLMRSDLKSAGAQYTVLAEFPLKQED